MLLFVSVAVFLMVHLTPGDPVEDEAATPEATDPEPVEEPEDFTIEQQEQKPVAEDIPGWARTIEPGYDIRAGNPETSARPQQAKRSGGAAWRTSVFSSRTVSCRRTSVQGKPLWRCTRCWRR